MDKLSRHRVQLGDGTPTVFTTKQLLLPIRALCTGQSLLSSAEEVALIATIKNSKIPQYVKSPLPGNEKDSPRSSKDSVRVRSDLSGSVLERLTVPLQDFALPIPLAIESTDSSVKGTNDAAVKELYSDTKVCAFFPFCAERVQGFLAEKIFFYRILLFSCFTGDVRREQSEYSSKHGRR